MLDTLVIRPETVTDTQSIAQVNYRAFSSLSEPTIAALSRQHRQFDPTLSLVAEYDGRVIGHALFLRHRMQLMGEEVSIVGLGPIAVDPDFQKQGIGGALIETGHALARKSGCVLSLLLGHDTYYPRFGYRTHQYGGAGLTVSREMLTDVSAQHLERRLPTEADLSALIGIWEHEESEVDFALRPDSLLFDWISPNRLVSSEVWLVDSVVVGYTRVRSTEASSPVCFMAATSQVARMMAAALTAVDHKVTLPLHPASRSTQAFSTQSVVQSWSAGMACPLVPGALDLYADSVKRGERPVGRVIWPVMFDA